MNLTKEEKINYCNIRFEECKDIYYSTNDDSEMDLKKSIEIMGLDFLDILKNVMIQNIEEDETFQFTLEQKEKYILCPDPIPIFDFLWEPFSDEITKEVLYEDEESYDFTMKQFPNHIQYETIESIKRENFNTGIVCIATGGGKSLIQLHLIQLFHQTCLEPGRSILIFTERKNILLDLFFSLDKNNVYIPNDMRYRIWKKYNIIHMDQFNLINLVSIKNNEWHLLNQTEEKTRLIIINRSFLVKKYDSIPIEKSPQFILFDECQSISARTVHSFLTYAKINWNSKIIGFSATPIRKSKNNGIMNINKIKEIFSTYENPGILNIYQNYNIMNAIQDNICSKLNFVWYKLIKDNQNLHKNKAASHENNRFLPVSTDDVFNTMKILNENIDRLYYKKIICWCSTITNAELYKSYYQTFMGLSECQKLQNIIPYSDHSKKNLLNDDYDDFRKAESNCIMFCVGKHREGSDIKNLDCCMFLDKVIERSDVVWLQSIGRISRKAANKKYGLVIDTFYEKEKCNDFEIIVDKLIGYYVLLDSLTLDETITNKRQIYEKARRDIILGPKEEHVIHMGNFNIVCEGIDWDIFAEQFDGIFDKNLHKRMNICGEERLEIICQILITQFGWNEKTHFWEEYEKIDKTLWNFPEDIMHDYSKIFSKKTWYDLMKWKPQWYKKKSHVITAFQKMKIYHIQSYEEYNLLCEKDERLPPYPEEWFRMDGYTDWNDFFVTSTKPLLSALL